MVVRGKSFNFKSKHKSKKGGLTEAGRKAYNRATGSNLKAPAPNPKTKKEAGRKKSFCARSKAWIPAGGCGGKNTRGCASRRRWKC